MTKRINIRCLGIKAFAGIERVTWVDGVNSLQDNGEHILMWDFDGVDRKAMIESLMGQQLVNRLSDILILDTLKRYNNPDPWAEYPVLSSYHAYCFTTLPWREAFTIVWNTPKVCQTYLKMAFVRGYFTLRFSPKNGRGFKLLTTLPGLTVPSMEAEKASSFVRYLTKRT